MQSITKSQAVHPFYRTFFPCNLHLLEVEETVNYVQAHCLTKLNSQILVLFPGPTKTIFYRANVNQKFKLLDIRKTQKCCFSLRQTSFKIFQPISKKAFLWKKKKKCQPLKLKETINIIHVKIENKTKLLFITIFRLKK